MVCQGQGTKVQERDPELSQGTVQERNSEATGQGMGSGARCTVIAAVATGACGVTANLDHTNTVTKHDGRSAKALTVVS